MSFGVVSGNQDRNASALDAINGIADFTLDPVRLMLSMASLISPWIPLRSDECGLVGCFLWPITTNLVKLFASLGNHSYSESVSIIPKPGEGREP